MSADIVLDENNVTVVGHTLKLSGFDLEIDGGDSRRPTDKNMTHPRRALVHDFGDGLTLNWDRDYPGGVTALGTLKVEKLQGVSPAHQVKIASADLLLDWPDRRKVAGGQRRAFVHDFNDGLTLNWNSDYPGGVTINGELKLPGKLTLANKDVGAQIAALEQKVQALEARIAALEAKVG
jgi:hypothetical protein